MVNLRKHGNKKMNPKKPKYKSGEKSLTPKMQESLLSVISSYRDEMLIRLTLALGCRRSDIIRLEWSNIEYSENKITYHEKKKGDKLHYAFVSNDIIQRLKKYQTISTGKYVIPGRSNGGHLSSKQAYNIFNKGMRDAKLTDKPWPFHSLRATCIKNCQKLGWTPLMTANHVNDRLSTIEEHYAVPSMSERQEAARDKPII